MFFLVIIQFDPRGLEYIMETLRDIKLDIRDFFWKKVNIERFSRR